MLKVSNGIVLVSLLLTYFLLCSSIFIVKFEHVITGWEIPTKELTFNKVGN